jgi:hypothetical protein
MMRILAQMDAGTKEQVFQEKKKATVSRAWRDADVRCVQTNLKPLCFDKLWALDL